MSNKYPCPVAGKCGGCRLQNMDYERQLRFKQAQVVKQLGTFCRVGDIVPSEPCVHYRNKASAAFGRTRGGQIISGIYQSGSHRIVKTDSCLLEDETADEILVTLRELVKSFRLTVYDERTDRGLIRHAMVRSTTTGEYLLTIVTRSAVFPRKNDFVKELVKRCPQITSIVQSVNEKQTTMVLGEKEQILYGKGYVTDELCGKRFNISARSFYQINRFLTPALYRLAIEAAALKKDDVVIDAYCGTGTIGIIAADSAGTVIGAELNPAAVKDAKVNAKLNGAENVKFICADAGKFMRSLAAQGEKIDVVISDPPRSGMSDEFIKSLAALKPERVVYVSCCVETLARDLRKLTCHGYKVKKITPVDMFPFTEHVETVISLVRKTPDMYVDFKIDLDEQDLTASEAHPTYEEIKAYIQKEYGVKVSSLYISQVKRKLGLEVGESYNKPKFENVKQPQCPPEKEKIIVAALKYFKMI